MQAYTLADRGTYLSMKDKIALQVLVEGDPELFNPYGIIAVNPDRHPHVNYEAAMRFIAWITSTEGQRIIGGFKREGQLLFFPDAVR
jgi:tungstate transport system substrate-binding protein